MLIDNGDTILVAHRRMFQQDETRFFLGYVLDSEHELLKLEGFSFVRDLASGHVIRKDELRTKLLSLASPGYLFYQVPTVADINHVTVENCDGDVYLMEGNRRLINLTERSHSGQI